MESGRHSTLKPRCPWQRHVFIAQARNIHLRHARTEASTKDAKKDAKHLVGRAGSCSSLPPRHSLRSRCQLGPWSVSVSRPGTKQVRPDHASQLHQEPIRTKEPSASFLTCFFVMRPCFCSNNLHTKQVDNGRHLLLGVYLSIVPTSYPSIGEYKFHPPSSPSRFLFSNGLPAR